MTCLTAITPFGDSKKKVKGRKKNQFFVSTPSSLTPPAHSLWRKKGNKKNLGPLHRATQFLFGRCVLLALMVSFYFKIFLSDVEVKHSSLCAKLRSDPRRKKKRWEERKVPSSMECAEGRTTGRPVGGRARQEAAESLNWVGLGCCTLVFLTGFVSEKRNNINRRPWTILPFLTFFARHTFPDRLLWFASVS